MARFLAHFVCDGLKALFVFERIITSPKRTPNLRFGKRVHFYRDGTTKIAPFQRLTFCTCARKPQVASMDRGMQATTDIPVSPIEPPINFPSFVYAATANTYRWFGPRPSTLSRQSSPAGTSSPVPEKGAANRALSHHNRIEVRLFWLLFVI